MFPYLLTYLRAALGPLLLGVAYFSPNRAVFAACLVAAFVSDIFDGVIARRLGIATSALRRLDSLADSIFYLCALAVVWLVHPQVLWDNQAILAVLLLLEAVRYVFDLWKFGREASYHMWSSKLWGIALFAAFYAVLVVDRGRILAKIAIGLGIVADVEGLLISYTLQTWRHDVPTIVHARRMCAGEDIA
ncbi:MAG: CDP-alcohol phosphatidyltransferase family protein [Acidiferrobacteraceae bacterium]